jgi:hypothetical protein
MSSVTIEMTTDMIIEIHRDGQMQIVETIMDSE